jgi:hypothetical protein
VKAHEARAAKKAATPPLKPKSNWRATALTTLQVMTTVAAAVDGVGAVDVVNSASN